MKNSNWMRGWFGMMAGGLVLSGILVSTSRAGAENNDDVAACLKNWGKSPFNEQSKFRVITAKVKVMGIGSDVSETTKTDQPELVLIRPAVTVMAKTKLTLQNPNGWYCLSTGVAVMGKMEIDLGCQSHLASAKNGATVMGSDDHQVGTTVMGSTEVNRVGDCKK